MGAIISSISASRSVEIKPNNGPEGTTGYTVFGNNENKIFEKMDDAIDYAVSEAKESAKDEARKRGAKGKLTVSLDIQNDEAEARNCIIYLGSIVTARAVGAVGF